MAQIRITTSCLVDTSYNLEKIASNLQCLVEEMTQKIYDTIQMWEGAAESEFYNIYFSELQPFMTTDVQNIIDGICGQLNGIVNALDETDADLASRYK